MKFGPFVDITLVLAARIVPGVLSLLAVPFYIRTLGAENYGAVGFFLAIQMVVGMLDFGLATAVLREISWLTGQKAPANQFLTLLRTFEIPFWITACVISAIGIFFGQALLGAIFSIDATRSSIGFPVSALIFIAASGRFPFSVYFAYLSGLGYTGRANIAVLVLDTLRTIGTVLLLFVSPSLMAFFGWQAFAAVATSLICAWIARRSSPRSHGSAAYNWSLYKDLRSLMVGTGLYYVVHGVAYNLDKILLPRFLDAADFGHYVAIGQLAVIAFWVPHAVWWAQNPRILAALATSNTRSGVETYALTATLMSAICSATILAVYLAAPALVRIWIGASDSGNFGYVLIMLTLGNAAYALSHLAQSIQQAAKTMVPLVLVYAGATFGVPIVAFLVLGTFTPLSGAAVWCGVYVLSFLGSLTAYLRHAPTFIGVWGRRVLLPLLLTVSVGALMSSWTHALPDYLQIIAGVCMGALAFVVNLVMNQKVRTNFWQLMSTREAV